MYLLFYRKKWQDFEHMAMSKKGNMRCKIDTESEAASPVEMDWEGQLEL